MESGWVALIRRTADLYRECRADREQLQFMRDEVSALEIELHRWIRRRAERLGWLEFASGGSLDRAEKLSTTSAFAPLDRFGRPCYSEEKATMDVSPQLEIVRLALMDPGKLNIIAEAIYSGNVKKLHVDVLALFFYQTADMQKNTDIINKALAPIVRQEMQKSKTIFAFLEKDPEDVPQEYGKIIIARILFDRLACAAILKPIAQILDHCMLDEEVDFSQETGRTMILSLMENVFEILGSALQSAAMNSILQIIGILLNEAGECFGENIQESVKAKFVWTFLFRHGIIKLLRNPSASPSKLEIFLSPYAHNNLDLLIRNLDIHGEELPCHGQLYQFCLNIADASTSHFEAARQKANEITEYFDFSTFLTSKEVRRLHQLLTKSLNSPSENLDDPVRKVISKEIESIQPLDVIGQCWIIPLSQSAINAEQLQYETPLLNLIHSRQFVCKSDVDIFEDTKNQFSLKSILTLLISGFAIIPETVLFELEKSKKCSLIPIIDQVKSFLSLRLNRSDQETDSEFFKVLFTFEALVEALEGFKESEIARLYSICESWVNDAYDSYKKTTLPIIHSFWNLRKLVEERIDFVKDDCAWFEKKLFDLKAYEIVSSMSLKFKYQMQLTRRAQSQLRTLESSNVADFISKFQSFVFGEGAAIAEESEAGLGLRLSSIILNEFISNSIRELAEDVELSAFCPNYLERERVADFLEALLSRKLYPALNYVIISVRSKHVVFQDMVNTLDFIRDDVFYQRLKQFSWIDPTHLDLPSNLPKVLWVRPAKELRKLATWKCKTPYAKLECLTNAFKLLLQALSLHLQKVNPGADIAFPALIYLIIHSEPKHLSSNLQFISQFRPSERLLAESGYCFTQFCLAQSFLMLLNHQMLSNVSEELWNQNMSK